MSRELMTMGQGPITMTSLELVDFINDDRKWRAVEEGVDFPSAGFAKLEHSDFMKKVPAVLGERAGIFSGTYQIPGPNGSSRNAPAYCFPKREACLMAMSYSYELQAKVFDRMTALESAASAPAPAPAAMSRMDILQIAMQAEQERLIAVAQRDEAIRTKAEIGSRREATAMATAAAKTKEVAKLQHELGRNQQHATVIAVENATKQKFAKNAYVGLRKAAKEFGLGAVDVVDQRYGSVKAWPAAAWRKCFGIELGDLFPGGEAA